MRNPYRFDCPECLAKDAVLCFIGLPEIWRCDRCHFWFERWELDQGAQTNGVKRGQSSSVSSSFDEDWTN
jgi:ribosomal protein L37AE/L43A